MPANRCCTLCRQLDVTTPSNDLPPPGGRMTRRLGVLGRGTLYVLAGRLGGDGRELRALAQHERRHQRGRGADEHADLEAELVAVRERLSRGRAAGVAGLRVRLCD